MSRAPVLGIVALCALAAIVLLPNLGGYPLLDPDEGRHAAVARAMLDASSWQGWIVPTLGGEPYYDKPVLFYWLTALAYRIVGVGELGARCVSTVSALGTVALVARLGTTAWGPLAGVAAAIVCVTTTGLVGVAHLATLDMLLTFWLTASVAALAHWRRTRGLGAVAIAAACTALGTLTKGLVAPVIVGSLVGLSLLDRRERRHATMPAVALAMLVYLVVAGPWHLVASVVDPAYLPALYLHHHLARAAGSFATSHLEPVYYFIPVLGVGLLPWTPVLPAALATSLGRRRRDTHTIACALWAGTVVVVFSASSTKLATYVLPAVPPLALLIGRHVALTWTDGRHPENAPVLTRAGLGLAALVCMAAPVVVHATAQRAYGGAFAQFAPLGWTVVPFGLILAISVVRDRPAWGATALATIAATVALVLFVVVAPVLAPMRSAKPLADAIRQAGLPRDTPIVGFGTRAPSLLFYTDLRPLLTRRLRDVRALRADHPLVLVLTTPEHRARLDTAGPWYSWVEGPRVVLVASVPPASPLPRPIPSGNSAPGRL